MVSDVTSEQLEAMQQIFGTDRLDDFEFGDEEIQLEENVEEMNPAEQSELLHAKMKEVFAPEALERAFVSKADEKIKATDMPERFQLRYAKRYCVLSVSLSFLGFTLFSLGQSPRTRSLIVRSTL